MKTKCLWCGCTPFREATLLEIAKHLASHFVPYKSGAFQYLQGNMSMFGKWSGFWSTIYLASPLLNSVRHWKVRKMTLDFGADPMVEHGLAMEGEKIEAAKAKP